MEIEGKIIAVMPAQGGVSARTGNSWKSQDYVIETHEQFPKKCVFRVFGEDKIANMNIQIGEELRVSFDIDAHEYQGRWFNSIRAFDVRPVVPNVQAPTDNPPFVTPAPANPIPPATPTSFTSPQPAAESDDAGDLPF